VVITSNFLKKPQVLPIVTLQMLVQLLIDRLWEKGLPVKVIRKRPRLTRHPDDQMPPVHRPILRRNRPHPVRTVKQLDHLFGNSAVQLLTDVG
jgi:hypothetical protein